MLHEIETEPHYKLPCPSCSAHLICSSQAGLLPFQRVQYQLNDLGRRCPRAGLATAARLGRLPNTLHTLKQLPPACKRMPAYENDPCIALSHAEPVLDRSS